VIKGKPSANLAESLEANEKARIAAQIKTLGPEGLAKLEAKLEAAKKTNDEPIPEEILTGFPVPNVASISWIKVQSARNEPPSNPVPPPLILQSWPNISNRIP